SRALPPDERARDKAFFAALRSAPDRVARASLMAEHYANSSAISEIVRRRTDDATFVLDHIDAVLTAIPGADSSEIASRTRVEALGFSLGGSVATRLAMTDPRCRAVVNLDGGAFGAPEDSPLAVPYLMIYTEQSLGANDKLKERSCAPYQEEIVAGAKHMDLT